jgi:FkbM family methyltransferase
MAINLRRNRSYWLRDPASEDFVLSAMQRLVRPGDTVFDAGANIGLCVRFLIQRFGASKVIAFEPMRGNQSLLNQNIHLGNLADRVQILEVALADFDGRAEFQTDDMSSASGTLDVVSGGEACQGRKQYGLPALIETVNVARLDTLIESGRLSTPNVIKVDVEGAEERLLRGAIRTLETHSPGLVIEHHGVEASRAVVRFLRSIGYHVFGYLNDENGANYKEIMTDDIEKITHMYSLQHCVACRDPSCLQSPILLKLAS